MKTCNYPQAIPAAFASDEVLGSGYQSGWRNGHGIACHNVPKLGAEILSDSLGRITVNAENIRDVHESLCFEAEMGARNFSPFEFLAHELNDLGDGDDETPSADEAWNAYECGVVDSIQADLSTYSDDDYCIAS